MNKKQYYTNYHFSHNDIFITTSNIVKETGVTNTLILIPHVCNNVGVFGGGFAKDVGDNFPIVRENFLALGKKESKLGRVQYIEVYDNIKTKNKVVVANMIAQNGTISQKNPRPLNYNALVYCMNDINRFIDIAVKNQTENVQIHCPRFGSGLAGGNWIFIQELINDIWTNHDVCIYNKKNNKFINK